MKNAQISGTQMLRTRNSILDMWKPTKTIQLYHDRFHWPMGTICCSFFHLKGPGSSFEKGKKKVNSPPPQNSFHSGLWASWERVFFSCLLFLATFLWFRASVHAWGGGNNYSKQGRRRTGVAITFDRMVCVCMKFEMRGLRKCNHPSIKYQIGDVGFPSDS